MNDLNLLMQLQANRERVARLKQRVEHPELLSPNERYKEALLGGTIAGMPGTIIDVPTVYLPTDLTKIPELRNDQV